MNDCVTLGVGKIDFRLFGSETACGNANPNAIVRKFYAVPMRSSVRAAEHLDPHSLSSVFHSFAHALPLCHSGDAADGAPGVRCNQMKTKRLALCCLTFSPLLFAAARHWKAGKVTADSFISSGASRAAGPHPIADDSYILIIRSDDIIYTAQERHAWNSWCLLLQGEEIRYSQDKRKLDVIDADGGKCRLDILKQEKRPSP